MTQRRQYHLKTDTSADAVVEQFSIDGAQGKGVQYVVLVAPVGQPSGDGTRVAREIRQRLEKSADLPTLTDAIQAANQTAHGCPGGHRYSVLIARIDLQTGALSYAYLGDVNAVRVTEYQTVDLLKGRRIHGYLGDDRFMAIGVGQAAVDHETSSEAHGYITLQAGAQPSGSVPLASLSAVETGPQQLAHRIVQNAPGPSAAVVIAKRGASRSRWLLIPIGILVSLVLLALVLFVFLPQDGDDSPPSTPTPGTTIPPPNGTDLTSEEPPSPDADSPRPEQAIALAPTLAPSPTPAIIVVPAASPAQITPDESDLRVELLAPADAFDTNGEVTFRWNADQSLPDGQAYEVQFRPENTNPDGAGFGWGGTTREEFLSIDFAPLLADRLVQPGTYAWSVWVVIPGENYEPLRRVSSDVRTILISNPNVQNDRPGNEEPTPPTGCDGRPNTEPCDEGATQNEG